MRFRSSLEKSYNLTYKIQKNIKKLLKKQPELEEDKIYKLINDIVMWHINNFDQAADTLYQGDLLKLARDNQKLLLDIFNMNNFLEKIKNDYDKLYYDNFSKYNIRRELFKNVLYKIIEDNPNGKGSEYGLLFAKAFNFDLSIPMRYASYEQGLFDPRFIEYVKTYKELGGTNTYVLSDYYKKKNSSKYNMEELNDVIYNLKLHGYLSNKVNSKY